MNPDVMLISFEFILGLAGDLLVTSTGAGGAGSSEFESLSKPNSFPGSTSLPWRSASTSLSVSHHQSAPVGRGKAE